MNNVYWIRGLKDASKYCGGVSTRQIARWISSGHLPHRKLGHRLLMFRPQDLDKCVEALAEDYAERKGLE